MAQSLKMIRSNICVTLVVCGKIISHNAPVGVNMVV